MAAQWGVSADEAVEPLVLALDVGSTASRGAIYDAHGRPVGKREKVKHSFTSSSDGTSEIDADQVLAELSEVIDRLIKRVDDRPIAAVALDTFASSMVVVDADGHPLTQCMTYADSRPHEFVNELRTEISETWLHQLTGTRAHSSYWPARLRWLRAEYPDVFNRAAHFLSLGDYVLRALTGVLATATSSAAWAGMIDRSTADWSEEVIAISGITREQLPPVRHLDQPLELQQADRHKLAERWPDLSEASWFAAIPDGLSANVGLGAGDSRTIGGTAATSGALRVIVKDLPDELPGGLWCYRVSHDRAIVGGAINDVGRALDRAETMLNLDGIDLHAVLEEEPTSDAPLVLPFFTGERSTGWAANARAVFTGAGASTEPEHYYRGVVEGIAISYARVFAQLRQLAPAATILHMGGSVTAGSPGVLQIIADVLGVPLTPVTIRRSTLLGTALLALETVASDVERISPVHADPLSPAESRSPYYQERIDRFESTYSALFG